MFLGFSLTFARNKDLPAGFEYDFSIYSSLYRYFSIPIFLWFQKIRIQSKNTNVVFDCSAKIDKIHTEIYKIDIP